MEIDVSKLQLSFPQPHHIIFVPHLIHGKVDLECQDGTNGAQAWICWIAARRPSDSDMELTTAKGFLSGYELNGVV